MAMTDSNGKSSMDFARTPHFDCCSLLASVDFGMVNLVSLD